MRYAVAAVTLLVILFIAHAQSQSCPNSQRHLPPSMCMQACNNTNCNMSCSGIPGWCTQTCLDFGFCPAVNCSSTNNCVQKCNRDCGFLICKTDGCTQQCQGSCKKSTCDSNRCMQTCQKGGCIMECTDKADYCLQTCTKDCTFVCNATQCQHSCKQGGCKYEGPPKNITICDAMLSDQQQCMQSGCPSKDCRMECSKSTIPQKHCQQICQPPRSLCPKAMTCDTANCTQACLGQCKSAECNSTSMCVQQCGENCKSTRCTSKICNQQCMDGACALNCANGTEKCMQTCNGTSCSSLISHASEEERQYCIGNCDSMQCNSQKCTQKCGGKCPKIKCNGDSCDQECSGESCTMHCPKSVKSCTQTCKQGTCKLLCEAENCKKNCTESAECIKYDPNSSGALFRVDLTLLVNGVFLVTLGVLF